MIRGHTRSRALLSALVLASLLAVPPSVALGHGEEGEAAAEVPARTLVQQALALLTQQDDVLEAQEKLEGALESKDKEEVQIASVREALQAVEKDDKKEAVAHMNEALAPGESAEGGMPGEDPSVDDREAAETPEPAAGALEHAKEYEPERGTAEWVGFVIGVALIGLAGLGLFTTARSSG